MQKALYHVTFLCRRYAIFKKKKKKNLTFFAHENIKKLSSKVHMAVWIFFSAAPTAQNRSRLVIHIGKVSQDTSVL